MSSCMHISESGESSASYIGILSKESPKMVSYNNNNNNNNNNNKYL